MDAADKLDIHDCIMKYAKFADERAFDKLGELFASADFYIGSKRVASRNGAAIVTLFEKAREIAPGATEPPMRHVTTNILIEPAGPNKAKASSYAMLFKVTSPTTLSATTMAVYDDMFEKVDGAWRFSERRIRIEYSLD